MEATARMGFFSPRRFGQLLLRELVSGYRGLLIAMAAVGGCLLVISVLTGLGVAISARTGQTIGSDFYLGFFQNLLFIGGFIVSSLAFREMWHNGGGIFYLTVPGSIFEKFATKLLVTSVGYALGATIYFTAVAAICHGVTLLIFGIGPGIFNPFDVRVVHDLLTYLGLQSLFLLGSVWFRKLAFVKTVLWAVIFAVAAAIIAAVVARIVFADHFVWHTVAAGGTKIGGWSLDLSPERLNALFAPGTRAYAGLMVFRTICCVFAWIGAPVLWVAGWFRLREVEV